VGRPATAEDVTAVATCLASGFHEDPLWGPWAFPEESSRARPLYELMRFWVSAGVRYEWVRMTDKAEAVAVWIPPAEPELSPDQEAAFAVLVDDLFGERADELRALFELFGEHHPEEPHFYLSLWATHREHAGRGLGSALIRDNLARIDAERMPAYLESTNPANLPRDEGLGFRPEAEFGPANGPVITTMWREPAG
jgi:GNAT superfamily N-acetyltransferase